LWTQQGALKLVQPLGVFFLPVGRLVRIVDWIRFISYILLSIKYFVNTACGARSPVGHKSNVLENTSEV